MGEERHTWCPLTCAEFNQLRTPVIVMSLPSDLALARKKACYLCLEELEKTHLKGCGAALFLPVSVLGFFFGVKAAHLVVFCWTPYVLRGVFYYQKSGQERLVLRLHIPQFSRRTLKVCSIILLRTAHLTIPWKFAEAFLTTNCLVGFHYFRKAYLKRNSERPLLSPFICHKALNQLTSRSPLCSWSSGGRRVVCRSLSWPTFSVFHCLEGGCDRYQQHIGSSDLYVVTPSDLY